MNERQLRENIIKIILKKTGKIFLKYGLELKKILTTKNSIFSRIYKIKDKNGKLTSDATEMSIILNDFSSMLEMISLSLFITVLNRQLNI